MDRIYEIIMWFWKNGNNELGNYVDELIKRNDKGLDGVQIIGNKYDIVYGLIMVSLENDKKLLKLYKNRRKLFLKG